MYKIVVLGAGGVGKSALTINFVAQQFVDEYDPTIEDSYRRQLHIDDRACVLDILDTAGQEEFGAMRDQYMRTGEGFLVVYDVTQRSTFDEMKVFHSQIQRVTEVEKQAMVVAANKCDLPAHEVSEAEGRAAVEAMGASFMMTSAKHRTNVDEAFCELVRQIDRRRNEAEGANGGKGKRSGGLATSKKATKLLAKKCPLF
jgi:GTPase KRas protein